MIVKGVNRKLEIRSDYWKTTVETTSDGFQMAEVLNEYFSSVFTATSTHFQFHLLHLRAINQNI